MTAIAPIQATRKMQPVDFTGMLEVAKELVGTGFLPKHITTPGQCVAIILAGRELGMEPMLSLRSITMVQGKIVVNADAQLALFKAAGGRAVFNLLNEKVATLWLKHPNGDEHTESFSMEDAKRAGLTNNPTWSKYPKAMLRSRVITAGLKSIGFEPTAGAYDPEELQAVAVVEEGEQRGNPTASPDTPAITAHSSLASTMTTERTLEWARAFEIPAGQLAGQKLGVCGVKQLSAFIDWADEKISNAGDESDPALVEFRAACQLLLDAKTASTSITVPPAGKVEDALETEAQHVARVLADGADDLPFHE